MSLQDRGSRGQEADLGAVWRLPTAPQEPQHRGQRLSSHLCKSWSCLGQGLLRVLPVPLSPLGRNCSAERLLMSAALITPRTKFHAKPTDFGDFCVAEQLVWLGNLCFCRIFVGQAAFLVVLSPNSLHWTFNSNSLCMESSLQATALQVAAFLSLSLWRTEPQQLIYSSEVF